MPKILIVISKSPYPPRSDGITIRMNPVFEYLNGKNIVDLLVVCDPRLRATLRADEAGKICRNVYEVKYVKKNYFVRKFQILLGLLSPVRAPYSAMRLWSNLSAKMVNQIVNDNRYDVILWIGMPDEIAVYLSSRTGYTPKIVLDWIDSPSLTYERTQNIADNKLSRMISRYRTKSWKKWERKINKLVDAAIYITPKDASYANGEKLSNISILPNGILDDFSDIVTGAKKNSSRITLGFLGNMGYESNIRAALRLYTIYKQLSLRFPGLRLKIIGREPSDEIKSLASDNVIVTGPVDSIWPDVFDTDIFIFPMVMGAGLQNKVLEALRANKPVITSSICAAGLYNNGDDAVIIADSNEEYCLAVEKLLSSEKLLNEYKNKAGDFARRYDWSKILPKYESILLGGRAKCF